MSDDFFGPCGIRLGSTEAGNLRIGHLKKGKAGGMPHFAEPGTFGLLPNTRVSVLPNQPHFPAGVAGTW